MADLGLDPETVLKLIQLLLRGAAYFFAGFGLVGILIYIVFLCLEVFPPRPRAKCAIVEVPQPIGSTSVAEQSHDLVPAEAPALPEGATVTRGDVLCEGLSPIDFSRVSAHQLSSIRTRNV